MASYTTTLYYLSKRKKTVTQAVRLDYPGHPKNKKVTSMISQILTTPCSNTGLNSQTTVPAPIFDLRVDALTLLWDETEFDILSTAKLLLGLRFDMTVSLPRKIGVYWDYCYKSVNGSLYMFRRTADGLKYRLAISGKDCGNSVPELLHHFKACMHTNVSGLRCSRMDIALDDYSKSLDPNLIVTAIDSGNRSGFRHGDYIRNLGNRGFTVYLGNRQSEHFVRYYDKSKESKGRIDSYRFESEFKGDKADFLFKCIATAPTSLEGISQLKKMVFGGINFYEKKDRNLSRSTIAGWWSGFVDRFTSARILPVPSPVKTSVESKMHWIKRQVSKSIATIQKAIGAIQFEEFISEVKATGSDKIRRIDDLMVLEYLELNQPM